MYQLQRTQCVSGCVKDTQLQNGEPKAFAWGASLFVKSRLTGLSQPVPKPRGNGCPLAACSTDFSARSLTNKGSAETMTGCEPILELPLAARDSTGSSVESSQEPANSQYGIRQRVRWSLDQLQLPWQCEPQKQPDTQHTNLRRAAGERGANRSDDRQPPWQFSNNDRRNATTNTSSTRLRQHRRRKTRQSGHDRANADTQGAANASPAAEKAAATQ